MAKGKDPKLADHFGRGMRARGLPSSDRAFDPPKRRVKKPAYNPDHEYDMEQRVIEYIDGDPVVASIPNPDRIPKDRGYAKGGSVRGCGIAKRGKGKGTMR